MLDADAQKRPADDTLISPPPKLPVHHVISPVENPTEEQAERMIAEARELQEITVYSSEPPPRMRLLHVDRSVPGKIIVAYRSRVTGAMHQKEYSTTL